MKVFITGGSGFIGSVITGQLTGNGHRVTITTRRSDKELNLPDDVSAIQCDTTERGSWQEKAATHDALINLAGTPIYRRWNAKNRREIVNSRLLTTRNVVEALGLDKSKKKHLLSVSGVGYYGYHGDEIIKEDSQPGEGFLADLAVRWEAAALEAERYGARVLLCRSGQVLGMSGGVLPKLVTVSKLRLGSPWGSGKQWTSWVHIMDLANSILFLLKNQNIEGPVNITSPYPIKNEEMMKTLTSVLKAKPLIPQIPGLFLRLIAGEFATSFLNGQRVIPAKLLDNGFIFKYETLRDALDELLR
ncbi:TIGR01777 family oxidoreductase [Chloroflexota bacterium]